MREKHTRRLQFTRFDHLLASRQGILLAFFIAFMVILVILPLFASGFWLRTLTQLFLLAAMSQGWNYIGGYTGYAAFGNVAFFGIGAYGTALAMLRLHFPFGLALIVGAVAAMAFAVLIGLPVLRLKGHYFAIATVALATALGELADFWTSFTGGAAGLTLPFFQPIALSNYFFYYSALLLVLFGLWLTYFVMKQKMGYSWVAVREDEDAAKMMGINTTWAKVVAFALSALLAAVAGAIYAYWNTFVLAEEVFKIDYTLQMILATVLGGPGTIFGPFIGAFLYYILITLLVFFLPVGQLHETILGIIIIAVMVFTPQGIMDFLSGRKKLSLSSLLENIRMNRV